MVLGLVMVQGPSNGLQHDLGDHSGQCLNPYKSTHKPVSKYFSMFFGI